MAERFLVHRVPKGSQRVFVYPHPHLAAAALFGEGTVGFLFHKLGGIAQYLQFKAVFLLEGVVLDVVERHSFILAAHHQRQVEQRHIGHTGSDNRPGWPSRCR